MKRRQFLSSAIMGSTAAAFLTADSRMNAQSTDSKQAKVMDPGRPASLFGPQATAGYFTESKLYDSLGTDKLDRPAIQVVAYNFPSWHSSPWMETRFGKAWTEYDTLINARTLFPGHTMPHYPLWGYYDESDPVWAAKEINLAADHGVDAWLVDWYWHEGTQFYQEQLQSGFLQAGNRHRLKFAVMWANHDWKNVYPARSPDEAAIMLPQTHSLADCTRVVEYCTEHYFLQSNYLHIDGAPLFAIFDCGKMVEQLGLDGLKRALMQMRERAVQLGVPNLHLQVCNGYDRYEASLADLGFDSATQYGTFGWTYGMKPPGSRIPYGVGAVEAVTSWQRKREHVKIPFYPCCSVGWDDSPRFEDFASIAINRSPDQFERLVRAARHTQQGAKGTRMVYIAAWNEWTEDHVLLPDSIWGYSYLEALHRAAKG